MFRSDVGGGEKNAVWQFENIGTHLDEKLLGNEYLKRRAASGKSFNILTVFVRVVFNN